MGNEVEIVITSKDLTKAGMDSARKGVTELDRDAKKASQSVEGLNDEMSQGFLHRGGFGVVKRSLNELPDDFRRTGVQAGTAAGEGIEEGLHKAGDRGGEKVTERVTGRLRDERGRFVGAGTEAGNAIGDGIQEGAKDKASSDKLLNAMKLVDVSGWVAQGGALGAGLAGGVAAGLVGVGSAVLPIALGAALVSGDATVQKHTDQMLNRMMEGGRQAASVLKGPLTHAIDDVSSSFVRMEPVLTKMFDDAVPSVEHLTRGVTGLAENALGGLAVATSRSETVMSGFEKMLIRTGAGVGAFFDNSTKHSLESGQNLAHFGNLMESALGTVGTTLDKLSAAYAPHAAQVEEFFHQAGAVIGNFSSTALPALMEAGGTTLQIFSAGLKVLAPFADEIGAVAGAVLPLYSAFKLLNPVLTPMIELLGAGLGAGFRNSAKAGSGFGSAVKGAAKESTGLLGTLGGLITSFPAVAGAAGVAGVMLGAYYLEQKKVSDFGDSFAQGMQSGGDSARKAAEDYGNVARELADLTKKRDEWNANADVQALGADDAKGSAMNDQIMAHNQLLDDAREKYDKLHDSLGPLGQRQLELNRAVAEHGVNSIEAMAASSAYQAQKEADTSTELTLQGAMKGTNEAYIERSQNVLSATSANLSYRNSVASAEEAQKTLNEAIRLHGEKSKEANDASRALEGAQIAQAEAARQQAMANSTATNEQSKQVAGTAAATEEILRMADAANGNWTPSMQTAMGAMSLTELATIGVTRSVNEAGQAVYRLPDGKTITVVAETQAAKDRLAEIEQWQISDKFFTVTMRQQVDVIGTPIAGSNRSGADGSQWGGGGFAHGGIVGGAADGGIKTGLKWVGEQGAELVRLPAGAQVIPSNTSRNMVEQSRNMFQGYKDSYDYGEITDELWERLKSQGWKGNPNDGAERIYKPSTRSGGQGSSIGGGGGRTVLEIRSGGSRLDDLLVELLRKAVQQQGGDVQTVLGGDRW